MNILVDVFGCFSLFVLASSLRIRETKSRGIQGPTLWKGTNIDTSENPARSREATEKDDEYSHAISDYENFHLVHDVPEISEPSRGKLHNTSEKKQDIRDTFPHQNLGVTTDIESFISRIKPYPFPGQQEKAEIKFNNLLCLTDCRMADLMVFNLKNEPGNSSYPFQNVALAGRPYSFSGLKSWCKDNCGKRTGWTNFNTKNNEFDGKDIETKRPNENDVMQFEDKKSAASDANIPYISFGAKPAGLLQPIPPVIPTIFFPPVRNFYPYPNIIATPLLYHRRNDRRVENTGQTSGVSFRSLRDNSPMSVSKTEYYPYQMHHQSKFKGRSYPSLAEYNTFRDSRKLRSDAEKHGRGNSFEMGKQPQQTDDSTTEKTAEQTKYYEDNDNYEDVYNEDDYDDDDAEDDRIDSVVRFLREVSRILSNKAFRVLLKRSSTCDSRREVLPGKEQNNTDLHSRGLH